MSLFLKKVPEYVERFVRNTTNEIIELSERIYETV